jgi:hypothetical protein
MSSAAFSDKIPTRLSENVNIDDALCDAELVRIAAAKCANNGNGNERGRYCDCDELIVKGRRVPVPLGHDCEYTRKRSALIVEASRIATERVGDPKGSAALGRNWTRVFNFEMQRLAYNAGLLR